MDFRFFIGGYISNHYEVILKEDNLLFYIYDEAIPIDSVEPTHTMNINDNPKWLSFLEFLKRLQWNKTYFNNDTMDGIQWELKYKNKQTKVSSSGSNEYPNDFHTFKKEFERLINKKSIPIFIFP